MDVKEKLGLDFANLPYLIDGELKLTETAAIHRYIANKYAPELNGITIIDKANVDMLHGPILDLKNSITMPCY